MRFYLDHDVPAQVCSDVLTPAGHECWTASMAGLALEQDDDQTVYATDRGAVLVSCERARSHPGCVQQPRVPFAIAATGSKAMRVAARYASTWVTNGNRSHEGLPLRADDGATVVARSRGP